MVTTTRSRKAFERFAGRASTGQALVEFALTVPVIFLLIVNAINFGGFIYGWITVANAARAASEYAIMGGAFANLPPTASATQIKNLIVQETSSLPGASTSNPSVTVCENNNDTMTLVASNVSPAPTCATTDPPKDPEAPAYLSLAADVTYTYPSFFTVPNFMGLAFAFPNGASIHRRTIMRVVQ